MTSAYKGNLGAAHLQVARLSTPPFLEFESALRLFPPQDATLHYDLGARTQIERQAAGGHVRTAQGRRIGSRAKRMWHYHAGGDGFWQQGDFCWQPRRNSTQLFMPKPDYAEAYYNAGNRC